MTTASSDKSSPLVERTIDALGRNIVHGVHAPNSAFPTEGELARQTGVGRNVVREATKVLTSMGLLRITQGSGTTVLPQDNWNYLDRRVIQWAVESDELRDGLIDELSTLRYIVEPEVAAIAARHATTTEILRLFEAYEEMERNKNVPERAVEVDILYHRHLFAAAHNKFLSTLLRTVVAVLRANFALAIRVELEVIEFLDEHRLVAEAINDRDPDRARSCMQTLLLNNQRHLTEMRQALASKQSNRS